MSFADLGLRAELLKSVAEQGYEKPSPIQAEAIPAILQGKDVMAAAQAVRAMPEMDARNRAEAEKLIADSLAKLDDHQERRSLGDRLRGLLRGG